MSFEAAFYIVTKNDMPEEMFEDIKAAIYAIVEGTEGIISVSDDYYEIDDEITFQKWEEADD